MQKIFEVFFLPDGLFLAASGAGEGVESPRSRRGASVMAEMVEMVQFSGFCLSNY
jgi:hypothetical protein